MVTLIISDLFLNLNDIKLYLIYTTSFSGCNDMKREKQQRFTLDKNDY